MHIHLKILNIHGLKTLWEESFLKCKPVLVPTPNKKKLDLNIQKCSMGLTFQSI